MHLDHFRAKFLSGIKLVHSHHTQIFLDNNTVFCCLEVVEALPFHKECFLEMQVCQMCKRLIHWKQQMGRIFIKLHNEKMEKTMKNHQSSVSK